MHPAFPPDSAPLEVDRVAWVPASAESVHVHLYGRWRDRPVTEPLVLLVGDAGRRRGFPALDPASAGALASFAVPNELRPALGRDIALQVGVSELELPAATAGSLDEAPGEEPEAEVIDRAVLAERRARRAELSEDTLTRRAQVAEQTAATLEAQLANLEERLGAARDERAELEAAVSETERRLRAAEQRGYAEQQLRIEAQDDLELVRGAHQAELTDLRRRLKAANERAEELAHEVDRARRATAEAMQRSEEDRGALRRAEEQLRGREEGMATSEADVARRLAEVRGAQASLAELRARTDDLEASLSRERAGRSEADRALDDEREAAQAKVTLLEHELDARRSVQDRITGELRALRAELERQQALAAEHERAEDIVARVENAAVHLKDRVVDLEHRKDAAEREVASVREVLAQRSAELERAKIDLARAVGAAEQAAQENGRHRLALEQAERTIEAVRASAGQLQLQLDVERRERAQTEAGLHEELALARAEAQRALTDVEVELRGEVAAQRDAVARQVASIEAHVARLRAQLVEAAATLRDELDTERAARQAAERQLIEERERAAREQAAERQRASEEREQAAAKLADERRQATEERQRAAAELAEAREREADARERAEQELAEERELAGAGRGEVERATAELEAERRRAGELEAQVAEAQRALSEQIARVRTDHEGRETREAQLQRLVGEVLRTSASLRVGFEAEIRELEGELTERIVTERREAAAELEAMEAQIARLESQVRSAGDALDADLQAERTARWLAEAELARERQRSGVLDVEAERERSRRLEAELDSLRAELARVRAAADAHAARSHEAQAVIEDLTVAAARLRDQTEPLGDDDAPAPRSAAPTDPPAPAADAPAPPAVRAAETPWPAPPAVEGPRPPAAESPETPGPPAVEASEAPASLAAEGLEAPGPPAAEDPEAPGPPAAEEAAPMSAVEAATSVLEPRVVAARGSRKPWLSPAIAKLASLDPDAAASLIVALLPTQRLVVQGDVSYDLTVEEIGTFRVVLHTGATTVDPIRDPGLPGEVDFHLAGPAAALAGFAGGGVRRRPKGTRVSGSKRRLRKLLKDTRRSMQLADVQASGAVVDPGLLLAVLTAAVEPAWTAGHSFSIVWVVTGEQAGTWHVSVRDGATPSASPGLPAERPAAIVHVTAGGLVPLLAGLPLSAADEAHVVGDGVPVALLRHWFDQAQGLA